MDPLSTFHICPFHFCAISEPELQKLCYFLIAESSPVHFLMVATIHDSQTALKQVISAEIDHCESFIQIGEKKRKERQRMGFGFQEPQFQLRRE